jgi:hypothetical protein
MASRYHSGRGRDDTNDRIVTQVEGIGLVLKILKFLEGGRSACLFVFGLHKLLWQHRILVLGLAGQLLQLTSLPTRPPQLSNALIVLTLLISQLMTRCDRSAWRMPSLSWNVTCFAQCVTYATMTTLYFWSLAFFVCHLDESFGQWVVHDLVFLVSDFFWSGHLDESFGQWVAHWMPG